MADDAVHLLRILEPDQPGLRQRIDRNDLGAVGLGLLEHRQHPRMVGAGILPGDDDQVSLGDVLDGDRALADPDRLDQRCARGFVTHVGAVGQVVGAEAADHQLVQERRLVAGASRGVEHRLVGAVQCAQFVGDQPVGVVPGDGPVVVVACAQHHRFGEPALLGQPVLGPRIQVGDGVPGEELRGDHPLGRFLGDGLGAVLAELGELAAPVILGPCAAGAVETVALIQPDQRRPGPPRAHGLEARAAATPSRR